MRLDEQHDSVITSVAYNRVPSDCRFIYYLLATRYKHLAANKAHNKPTTGKRKTAKGVVGAANEGQHLC